MTNDWIIDVLADLKSFAQANGLPALAEQLDDTTLVAASELSQAEGRVGDTTFCQGRQGAYVHRTYADSKNL